MQEPVSPIQITLPVRQLVEFLRRAGSIDNRFTGFDRANGGRTHPPQIAARRCKRTCRLRRGGISSQVFLRMKKLNLRWKAAPMAFLPTADGVTVVDEIKTTALPGGRYYPGFCTGALGTGVLMYAAIYAATA